MATEEVDWDTLLVAAKQYQQDFYELLSDWTIYEEYDYACLRQNIGFALFGPPTEVRTSTDPTNCTTVPLLQITENPESIAPESLCYDSKAESVLSNLYEKVIECGKGYSNDSNICYGLIINVLLPYKPDKVKKEEEGKEEKTPEEEKKAKEKEEKERKKAEEKRLKEQQKEEKRKQKEMLKKKEKGETDENEENEKKEDVNNKTHLVPLFKVRRRTKQEDNASGKNVPDLYETWYIDINCRVYKSWESYKQDNTLHRCIMLLPKDGFYQPDPSYPFTESESVVWLEMEESPACSITSTVLAAGDGIATVVGVAGIAVGVASLVTPIGPLVLAAGVAATGVNGLWTAGRSAHNLFDRHVHEESINPLNLTAFGAWLGIVGAGVGLAASGSAALLSRAVQNGRKIGTATQIAYNALVIGNMSISGIGIGLQGYSMYENYRETQTVNAMDLLLLASHVLFFSNAVINIQFAGELIRTTQGQVLDEYQSSLRSKSLRKKFNKAKRAAAANHPDPASQNAEVICYINNKKAMAMLNKNRNANANVNPNLNANAQTATTSAEPSANSTMSVNGSSLIDPTFFLKFLFYRTPQYNEQNNDVDENEMRALRELLLHLLTSLFDKYDIPIRNVPTVPEFEEILREVQLAEDPPRLLRKLFHAVIRLVERSEHLGDFIVAVMFFLWRYMKENLRYFGVSSSISLRGANAYRQFNRILDAILEGLDVIVERLLSALSLYIENQGMLALQM